MEVDVVRRKGRPGSGGVCARTSRAGGGTAVAIRRASESIKYDTKFRPANTGEIVWNDEIIEEIRKLAKPPKKRRRRTVDP